MGIFSGKSQTTAAIEAQEAAIKPISFRKEAGPAVDKVTLEKAGSIDLTKRYEKTGLALNMADLSGARAETVLYLDHSYSMVMDYRNGLVQKLVERKLAFSAQVDNDGKTPLVAFDNRLYKEITVDLGNFDNIVNQKVFKENDMSGTTMAPVVYDAIARAKKSKDPIFATIIGDGSPQDRAATRQAFIESARYPIFWKLLAIKPVDFLQELDDISDNERLLDNVDAKFIDDPYGISDLDFAKAMVDEWAGWISLAQSRGVLQ